MVYIDGLSEGKPHAYGPHIVEDPATQTLRNMSSQETFICEQEVAYKEGPPVVVLLHEGRIAALYADIPLELVFYEQILDSMEPLREITISRPRPIEALPTLQARYLEPFKDELYGKWEVTKAKTADPDEKRYCLRVDNRLAAMAVINTLIKQEKPCEVKPLAGESFEIRVTGKGYDYLRSVVDVMAQEGAPVVFD